MYMRNKTCAFFCPDYFEADSVGSYTRWVIGSVIEEDEISCFLFGSGGDFERVCYDYIKESREKNKQLVIKVVNCETIFDLEKMIDECNVCIFSNVLYKDPTYICEGIKIGPVSEKLSNLRQYAIEKNKKIMYI